MTRTAHDKVIDDFGQQWTTYQDNSGYYGSNELFAEIVEPLAPVPSFRDLRVAEIGSGTGRIIAMLCRAGVRQATAVEPSAAYDVLVRNVSSFDDQVRCVRCPGDQIPADNFDRVLSIGVLHHIPDPVPTVAAAFRAIRPGGTMLIWLYGKEGNAAYLAFVLPLRALTKKMPHWANAAISHALDLPLRAYIFLCRYLSLPLHRYMNGYLGKLAPDKRRLVIYDQINPEWAKYYTREEAVRLLSDAGFTDVQAYHRGGYSWTVLGTKPANG